MTSLDLLDSTLKVLLLKITFKSIIELVLITSIGLFIKSRWFILLNFILYSIKARKISRYLLDHMYNHPIFGTIDQFSKPELYCSNMKDPYKRELLQYLIKFNFDDLKNQLIKSIDKVVLFGPLLTVKKFVNKVIEVTNQNRQLYIYRLKQESKVDPEVIDIYLKLVDYSFETYFTLMRSLYKQPNIYKAMEMQLYYMKDHLNSYITKVPVIFDNLNGKVERCAKELFSTKF